MLETMMEMPGAIIIYGYSISQNIAADTIAIAECAYDTAERIRNREAPANKAVLPQTGKNEPKIGEM